MTPTTTPTTAATAGSPAATKPPVTPGRRRRGMTEEAAEAAIDQACRALRLPTIRTRAGEMLVAAEKEQLTYRGFLAELLLAECDDRDRRRTARRVKAAGFPREKWGSPAGSVGGFTRLHGRVGLGSTRRGWASPGRSWPPGS
jgi:hypothetical protein